MAPDIIQNYENGIVVDVENTNELINNSLKVIQDPSMKNMLINNAYNDVNKFKWENIAKRYYDDIYRKIL